MNVPSPANSRKLRPIPAVSTLAAFVGVAVLGGINGIAVKVTVQELAPLWSAAIRFLAAGALLAAFVVATRRSFPSGQALAGAAGYGLIAFAGSYALLSSALRDVSVGTVMVFLALVPLETFGLAILLRQERFHLRGLAGGLVALLGVLVIVADQLGAAVPIGSLALVFAGTLFIAQGGITLKAIPRSDPFATNAVAMLSGGLLLVPASAALREPWVMPGASATWAALGYLIVLGSIVLFGLYLFVLRRWTATAVSYVTLLMPLITLPLAAALIAETVSPVFLLGGAIALAGVYLGAFATPIREAPPPSLPECLPPQPRHPAPAKADAG